MQWLFFEQFSHKYFLAKSRHLISIFRKPEEYHQLIGQIKEPGHTALIIMENYLKTHLFFVNESYIIADISLFSYTHIADEGVFSLQEFPAIQAWIKRIQKQPKYISIKEKNLLKAYSIDVSWT